LGRFIQPDTVVPNPGNPQALNRYSYVLNNPIKYRDPSGHCIEAGLSSIPCAQVFDLAARTLQQLQALVVQYGPQVIQGVQQFGNQIPALADQLANPGQARGPASSNAGNTAGPGGLDPNNWDPNRFKFKNNSSLQSHFTKHVLESGDEAWEEVLGITRAELESARSDPGQLARLQDAYVQLGQQASSAGNYIGAQAQGQRVFVDTSNKVVSILQGDRLLSLFRLSSRELFIRTMRAQGLELAPGVDLDAILHAAGL